MVRGPEGFCSEQMAEGPDSPSLRVRHACLLRAGRRGAGLASGFEGILFTLLRNSRIIEYRSFDVGGRHHGGMPSRVLCAGWGVMFRMQA